MAASTGVLRDRPRPRQCTVAVTIPTNAGSNCMNRSNSGVLRHSPWPLRVLSSPRHSTNPNQRSGRSTRIMNSTGATQSGFRSTASSGSTLRRISVAESCHRSPVVDNDHRAGPINPWGQEPHSGSPNRSRLTSQKQLRKKFACRRSRCPLRALRPVAPTVRPSFGRYEKVIEYCRALAGHREVEEFRILYLIRRLTGRRAVNGVYMDELAAALVELGWAPDRALRHPRLRDRRYAHDEEAWERRLSGVPCELRAVTLGTFLDPAPAGTWAIATSDHFVAYGDGFVADNGAFFSRKPAFWFRAIPEHDRVALRRVREAVRFVRVSTGAIPRPQEC